jgi:hypothetical protein
MGNSLQQGQWSMENPTTAVLKGSGRKEMARLLVGSFGLRLEIAGENCPRSISYLLELDDLMPNLNLPPLSDATRSAISKILVLEEISRNISGAVACLDC